MMNKSPLVSVIIPTYKRPDFLKRAICSVLNQTHKNIEVIVVDDNNPNSEGRRLTEDVMQEFLENPQVKYIKHEKNKNGSAARNTGFRNSKGELIALLDDDDEFLPEKIESQIKCLSAKDETFGACYSNYLRIGEDGKLLDKNRESREGFLYLEALKRNLFTQGGSNLLIKREMFQAINGFDESYERNQDIEFMARLFTRCKLAYCDTMGLKIYITAVGKKRVDFLELTEKFKAKFNDRIAALSEEEQKEVYKYLDVQVLRHLAFSQKDIPKFLKVKKEKQISIIFFMKYCLHLFKRRITKTVFGFEG